MIVIVEKIWRSKEQYVSSARADWLITLCHSNVGNSVIVHPSKSK